MREAALALGITRWRAVVGVVIPGDDGDYHREMLAGCTYRRGNGPAAVYGTREFFLGLQGLLNRSGRYRC